MNKILIIVGILLIAGLGYLHYDSQQQLKQSRQKMFELKIELEQLKHRVSELEIEVRALEKSSVEAIVRDANSAILEGWESLVNTVENEIKKARESIKTPDQAPQPNQ